ncbi:MAG: ABC transporter ATP-binding protein, partial [Alicyclobacillus sp.]|nr:ABC transporter ATP-binding protein [Alicyclobacillus sp.]
DMVHAVNGVSLTVKPGEWLGVLGESGSGKSVTFLAILGLLGRNGRIVRGEAWFGCQDLLRLPRRELQRVRGRHIGYVFQNVASGLNPFIRVGQHIVEPMLQHRICSKSDAKARALELMDEVGIPDPQARFHSYPFELSGGIRQRVMIASALACDPTLLILDEPTSALDATMQVQVISVLKQATARRNMSTVLVTHDMGLATNVCDRIVILYACTDGGLLLGVVFRAGWSVSRLHT